MEESGYIVQCLCFACASDRLDEVLVLYEIILGKFRYGVLRYADFFFSDLVVPWCRKP